MTSITDLIDRVSSHIPFRSVEAAQAFLDGYSVDDQAALISALYIGRDHIHDTIIRDDYVPAGWAFDRYFTTGREAKWDIPPRDFARILYEKGTNLPTYFTRFTDCTRASKYQLESF